MACHIINFFLDGHGFGKHGCIRFLFQGKCQIPLNLDVHGLQANVSSKWTFP